MAQRKSHLRSTSRLLALEPRLLFDGAAMVAAQDAAQPQDQHPADADSKNHITDGHDVQKDASRQAPFDFDLGFVKDEPVNVVLIDSRVPQLDELVADLKAGGAQVHVVQVDESGLTAISNALAQAQNADSLQIISHGASGSITLGTDTINSASLQAHSAQVQDWAYYLTQDADILLYGCDVAAGEQGQAFIRELAYLSSADIAASTDVTGAASLGGNWTLEARTGSIEAGSALSARTIAGFSDVLADPASPPKLTDKANPDEPTFVPEDPPKIGDSSAPYQIARDIEIAGVQATDQLSVTVSVGKGSLIGANAGTPGTLTLTGTAAEIQSQLAALEYRYTGSSEIGDADTLTLTVINKGSGSGTSSSPVTFTRNFHIAPVNDAPTLTPPASGAGRLQVDEGGSAHFTATTGTGTSGDPVIQINLGLIDPDNSPSQIIIKITDLPKEGKLFLNNNELTVNSTLSLADIAKLEYRHNGKDVPSITTDGFKFNVDDGAGGLVKDQQVTIDILPVNQAPSAGGNITLIEGETNVSLVGGKVPIIGSDRGNLSISDTDSADKLFTVKVTSLPTHGKLMFNGVEVAQNQVFDNLSQTDLAKFSYSHDGSETTSDSFVVDVTDQGGGTAAKLTSTAQKIDLTIIPNNDDPVWDASTQPDANNTFHVEYGPDSGSTQNGPVFTLGKDILLVTDAESDPSRIVYTLTEAPTSGGYLTHADYPGQSLPKGFSFTQKDINDGKIQYVSINGSDHTAEIKFTIMDGDRRLIPNERDGGIYADDNATELTEHTLELSYKGTAVGNGPGPGIPPAAEINRPGGDMSLSADQLAEGQTFVLGHQQLNTTDNNPNIQPEQIVYRLLSLPENGTILLNGKPLGMFGSFTQADVNAGRVSFKHDASENFTSQFSFDVSNGTETTSAKFGGPSTFSIDVKPQNDTPEAGQGEDIKLSEGGSIVINANGKQHITLSDADNTPGSDKSDGYAEDNALSFEVTDLPKHGDLYLDGVKQTGPFTVKQAQLDGGLLKYVHDGSENYSDSFTIVPLDDRGVGTGTSNTDANNAPPSTDPNNHSSTGAAKTIVISVNPLNDAPTFVGKGEPGYNGAPKISEGEQITIWGAGSYKDGTYGTGSGTAVADPSKPYYLIYQDSDNSSEQRQYVVTTPPKYGTLTVNGRVLGAGSVFTQAELDAGLVQYKHSGSEIMSDSFFYVVRDGDFGANESTTGNESAFAQGSTVPPSEFRLMLEHANDKPSVSTDHNGLLVIPSSKPENAVDLPKINLSDIDLKDGVDTTGGEQDFLQVTVQFQDADGSPYSNGVLSFKGTRPASLTVIAGADGMGNTLIFQGTLKDVQAALDAVQVRTAGLDADSDQLKIKVTVDDRLRDPNGALIGGANGGTANEGGASMTDGVFNTASIEIKVAASDHNDPPIVSLPAGVTVNEDERTLISGVSYDDVDAFDSEQTVSLTVKHGQLYLSATGTDLPAGVKVTAGALGTNTLALTGTQADLKAALAKLHYVSDADYNGNDELFIDVRDGGKNGLDGDDPSTDPSKSTGTLAIAIKPVNDKPVIDKIPTGTVPLTDGGSYDFNGKLHFDDSKDFRPDGMDPSVGFDEAADSFTVTLTVTSGSLTVSKLDDLASITGNGSGLVVLTGTRAQINAALDSMIFSADSANGDAPVTFKMKVDDGNNGGSPIGGIDKDPTVEKSFVLLPTTQNDPPTVTLKPVSDNTYTENGQPVYVDQAAKLYDPELSQLASWNGATLTIQRDGTANPEDIFSLGGSATLTGNKVMVGNVQVGTATNTGGVLTITFNDKASDALVQKVVQAVQYQNSSEAPPDHVTLNYTVNDQSRHTNDSNPGSGQDQGSGGQLTGSKQITLNITREVDKPDVSAPPAKNAVFTENGSAVIVDNGFTISDKDDDNIHLVTVQITGNRLTGDILSVVTDGTGITASYDASTGKLTLSGVASIADYNQVLQSLKYSSTSEDPTQDATKTDRTLSYKIYDNGSSGAGTAGTVYTEATRTVTVIPVNDAPVLSGGSSSHSYTENGNPITLEPGLTLSDVDDTQFTKVTVQITQGRHADDVLGLDATKLPQGWTANYDSNTGMLTLSGPAADKNNVQALLSTVTYHNTGDNPGNADRTISWTVTDADSDKASNGAQTSNVVTTTVHVIPVNDPPVAVDDSNSVTEDDYDASGKTKPVSGNVITGVGDTNSLPDSDPDTPTADLRITEIRTGAETAGGTMTVVKANGDTVIKGQYGTLTIRSDGSYDYVLDNSNSAVNQLGSSSAPLKDLFTYTLSDGSDTDQAQLTITIHGKDDAPPGITPVDHNDSSANEGAANGQNTVYESGLIAGGKPGEPKTASGDITVAAPGQLDKVEIGGKEFTLADLQSLTTSNPSSPINTGKGTLVITGFTPTYAAPSDSSSPVVGGTIHYSYTLDKAQSHNPDNSQSQEVKDDIALKVTDKASGSTGTGTLTIAIVDDAPDAKDDSFSTRHNTPVSGDVLRNDYVNKDGVTVSLDSGVSNGTLTLTPDGKFTYVPNAGFSGTDSFSYIVTDADGDTSTAAVTITVPPNGVPHAGDDTNSTKVDTPVSGDLTGNDLPSSDGGNIWTLTTPPGNGTVTITPDGQYTYTPKPGFTGKDSFTYTITDKDGDTSTATVTVIVSDIPKANDDKASTPPDTPVSGDLTDNDIPSKDGGNIWTVTTLPGNGTVTIKPDGHYTYTPKPGFVGEDSFTYTITDKDGDTSTATVTITVNDVPQAFDDKTTTPVDTPVSGDLTSNDIPSKDGGNIWTVTTPPGNGTVTITPDGKYTYTPKPGFAGEDSFTYTITDKNGDTSTATVTVTVNGVPKANDDKASTPPDTPISGDLTGNDVPSQDGGNIWTVTTPPGNGTVTITPDGHYTYTPKPGFVGEDSFTYTITDKDGDTSTATVTITVTPTGPNPLPPPPIGSLVTGGNDGLPGYVPPPGISTVTGQNPRPLLDPSTSPLAGGDAIYSPSVFWEWHGSNPVMSLPLPMHPIAFVNDEVRRSQEERQHYQGSRILRQPQIAPSIGQGLGMDPTTFVLNEVRQAQREGQQRDDRAAPTPSNLPIAPPSSAPDLDTVELPSENSTAAPVTSPATAAAEPDLLTLLLQARSEQAAEQVSEAEMPEAPKAGSSSFREQLQAQAHQLPVHIS